jgi:predicted RNA-binding protein YlxR (DUF448 family)
MTNNKQQTAVEWLEKICNDRGYYLMSEYFEQAKAIDKQRIAKAFTDGKAQNFSFYDKTGEQYYEQTYGGGEQ